MSLSLCFETLSLLILALVLRFQKLSGNLKRETENVEGLQNALAECKVELKILVEQAEKERNVYADETSKQQLHVCELFLTVLFI